MKLTVATSLCLALASASKLRPNKNAQTSLIAESAKSNRSQVKFEGSFPSYMHTSEEIHDELKSLAGSCEGAHFNMKTVSKTATSRSVDIDHVTIKSKGGKAKKNKVFLLFGEHARELISAESALHFIKLLCSGSDKAQTVLAQSEFQIIPNGNPDSRKEVEGGDFCKRANPNGVDLNRNWDSHWQSDTVFSAAETNPGTEPFSEPETQIFKELVAAYNPDTFLTIHSGTLGMYMPWAFDMEHLANRNQPQMLSLLEDLDKDYCKCPFGAAGKEVGYSCPGTCLDWVFSNLRNTKYAYAFEIYVGGDKEDLRDRWKQKVAEVDTELAESNLLQLNRTHLANDRLKPFFEKFPSNFVQLKSQTDRTKGMTSSQCFSQFNPSDASDYQDTVDNWSDAYVDMANKIAAKL
eukprot:TRINITY_DN1676_c0_g1_i1.p1 TRINITY_DN1676_c0_g1~~TRINITY_DN1676_c0_g1_i1.p1  ORF type:complete len:407 (+),score=87.14 TRINITY_DN1676_c0_g1_i1:107-1327(+)